MREFNSPLAFVHTAALDQALKTALPGKVIGVSTYGAERPIAVWMQDDTTPADDTAVQAILDAHDPVFLGMDKTLIRADGQDAVLLTIYAPRAGAADVTPVVAGQDVPLTLVNGLASDTLTALDPGAIIVTVKNGANRSTDSLMIQVV